MTTTLVLTTPDGRRLACEDGGDPAGYPVIGLHGTPGCRYSRWPDDRVYARAGVRYLTLDRAGYGRSDRSPGRDVAAAAADVLFLADTLGLHRFGVTGGSGGGPHALACAALLDGRAERVTSLSGLAPYGADGLPHDAWFAGMDEDDAAEARWALGGERRLAAELPARQELMLKQLSEDVGALLGEDVPEADRAFLERPELAANWRRIVEEQCRDGVYGWLDDSLAFMRPWGFALADIRVPVLVWYGLLDVSVPPAHGERLSAAIPGAWTIVDSDGGHLPVDPEAEIARNMAWLARGER